PGRDVIADHLARPLGHGEGQASDAASEIQGAAGRAPFAQEARGAFDHQLDVALPGAVELGEGLVGDVLGLERVHGGDAPEGVRLADQMPIGVGIPDGHGDSYAAVTNWSATYGVARARSTERRRPIV